MNKKPTFFILSVVAHLVMLLVLVVSVQFALPLSVVVNTNQKNIISAVVLGDTEKSQLLPDKPRRAPEQSVKVAQQEPPKAAPKQAMLPVKKEVIAIKPHKPEKVTLPADLFGKRLLEDIQKVSAKKKAFSEKQLKAQFEKTFQEQAEKTLRQPLLDDSIKIKGTETVLAQGVVDQYTALIQQAVREEWVFPAENGKLSVRLLIRVAPGGTVLDVQVTKSSGDPSLDSSARAAVFKASPLPVPKDAKGFETFRRFVLTMRPLKSLSHAVIG